MQSVGHLLLVSAGWLVSKTIIGTDAPHALVTEASPAKVEYDHQSGEGYSATNRSPSPDLSLEAQQQHTNEESPYDPHEATGALAQVWHTKRTLEYHTHSYL